MNRPVSTNVAEHFDEAHRQLVTSMLRGATARSEWPTWLLIGVVYGSWFGSLALFSAGLFDLAAVTLALIIVNAWYMSLQHELLHGHPTKQLWFNKLLGYAPLAVWVPYSLYRDSHLKHHRDADLTLPGVDPESTYVQVSDWRRLSPLQRRLWRSRKTFVGRLVIEPPLVVWRMLRHAVHEVQRGDLRRVPMWLTHGCLLMLMLWWIDTRIGIAWWWYLVMIGLPTLSLAMVRSFYEHRAVLPHKARIVINEAGPLTRLLYLNNNYHLVHHDLPRLPWYLLPTVYKARRSEYLAKCDGFHIEGGYWELLWRHAFKPVHSAIHPFAGRPTRNATPVGHRSRRRP